MKDETKTGIVCFFVGILVGVLIFAVLLTDIVDKADNIEPPDKIYEVTIDDLKFRCSSKPIIKYGAVWLRYCEGTASPIVAVGNFELYAVREINTLDQ